MKKKQWRKKFENEYLDSLVNEYCNIDDTYEISDQGKDYFQITINHFRDILFSYNKPMAKQIIEVLDERWEVDMQYTVSADERDTTFIILVSGEDKINIEFTNRSFSVFITNVHVSKKAIRPMIHKLKEAIAPTLSYDSSYIIGLFDNEEIKEFFNLDPSIIKKNLHSLDLSMRSWNGLASVGCKHVIDIIWNSKQSVSAIHQLGERSYKEIWNAIDYLGLPWNVKEHVLAQQKNTL